MSSLSELIHWNKPSNIPVQKQGRFGKSLTTLHEDMDQMIREFLDGTHFFPAWKNGAESPSVDIIENGENFKVNAELAGMDPDDVEVSVTDGFLTIKGEKEEEEKEEGENYLRRETSYGSFRRVIALPETANCDKAEATFKNGILKIAVPKKEGAIQKPKKLEIKKAA
jgi:HSP20 family protein